MHYAKIGALLVLGLLPVQAMAQSAAPSPERAEAREKYRAACGADIQRFCPNVERGKGQTRECLSANEASLSPTCKAAREERAAARAKEKS